MGMPLQQTEWTAAQAIALPPDGNRYEVLDGELFVTPAPTWRHQTVIERLFPLLDAYVRTHEIGWTKLSPADIVLSEGRLVQPDIFVVPSRPEGEPRSWREVHRLLLAVEVVSPSSARADRIVKRRIYQQHEVPEYWTIDLDAQLIERWRPADTRPELVSDTLVWAPRTGTAPLELEVSALVE